MQLGEQSWPATKEQAGKVVVVPLGAFEQHGYHLPLLTDSLIGGEIARRAEQELADEALFLPMLWLGASDHHLAFPGTVSLHTDTYIRVLTEMLDSLIVAGGFRRIFLLNAHAGNISPARIAISDAQIRHKTALPDLWLAFASWFDIAREQAAAIEGMRQSKVIHACEWETSLVQVIRPDLVGDDRPATRRDDFASAFYVPDFGGPSRVDVARTMDQAGPTGAFGYPEEATPEKGEALLAAATQEVVAFVREFAGWPATLETDGSA